MEGLGDSDPAQVYYAWFAKELNPMANGPSSNPLALYETLDTAVKKKDVNHPKLKDLRANLLWLIHRSIGDRTVARPTQAADPNGANRNVSPTTLAD